MQTTSDIILKLLGYLLFFRERLQLDARLDLDHIPFRPDVVELDYELRPVLWIKCGDCTPQKLDKLAVKVPEAEIWVLGPSRLSAHELVAGMAKANLRRERYQIIGFDDLMMEEMGRLLAPRNDLLWVSGTFEPAEMQFDFNGLWFDATFEWLRF